MVGIVRAGDDDRDGSNEFASSESFIDEAANHEFANAG